MGRRGRPRGLRSRGRHRSPRAARDDPRAGRWALLAGVLLGLAVLFRLDLVLGVGLAGLALVRGMDRGTCEAAPHRVRAPALAPYVIHIATAGPGHVFQGMVIDPVFRLRGGRSLPIPPPWGHLDGFLQQAGALAQLSWPIFPTLARPHELFLWFFLLLFAIAFVLWQGWRATRADPSSIRGAHASSSSASSALGILPQALQRVDSGHFSWVSCVVVRVRPDRVLRARAPARAAGPAAARSRSARARSSMAVLLFVIPAFTVRTYTELLAADVRHPPRRRTRSSTTAASSTTASPTGPRPRTWSSRPRRGSSKPGQRLFVGPVNLRKTPYSDAYLYYMLPDLVPATYFIEMDPGMANANGSRMPQDLASADIVILSAIWDDWTEPNDSRKVGSDASRTSWPATSAGSAPTRPVPAVPEVPLIRAAAGRLRSGRPGAR